MNPDLHNSLQSNFGFTDFRKGQEEAIQSILCGHNTLVVMPTGSGKSLIYQLAALHLEGLTLVISPLIALMKDQVDHLLKFGIQATFINSTLSPDEQNQRLSDMEKGRYRLVFIAPERLRNIYFLKMISHQKVSLLAVDEAHCISQWGHDFRPDYLHIAQFRSNLGNPLCVALTATATIKVQDDIVTMLKLDKVQRVVTGFNRPNLALEVQYTPDESAKLVTLRELSKSFQNGAVIIYTGTRRDTEEVTEFINKIVNMNAEYYHAGLPGEERTRIQEAFMAGGLSIVVATNAFGMGVDRADVRQVIHYSTPGSLEAYYQEAGRAGRDGLPSKAVLLYSPKDRALQEWFIENSNITFEDMRKLYNALGLAKGKQKLFTDDEISLLTGFNETKVRVVLSKLEQAGALENLGDEGNRFWISLKDWNRAEVQLVVDGYKQFQAHQKAKLDQMIAYAESNECRRRIILNYFGDSGSAEAEICCDNCQTRKSGMIAKPLSTPVDLTPIERIPLVILDTVRRLPCNVGIEKVALILKGSKAKEITEFGYERSVYYGRFSNLLIEEIKELIHQLLSLGYFKIIGGKYPVLQLTPAGEAAIQNKRVITLKLPRNIRWLNYEKKKHDQKVVGKSIPAQVKKEDHIEGIAAVIVECVQVIPGVMPRSGIAKLLVGSNSERVEKYRKHPFYNRLAGLKRYKVLHEIDRLLTTQQIAVDKHGNIVPPNYEGQSKPPTPPPVDEQVKEFLTQAHPRQLPGPWDAGWALGFHSQFAGADWHRSGVGELAYRLKYQGDLTVLPLLVDQAEYLIKVHPELAQVDMIVPVPPSTARENDPVSHFGKALAARIGLPFSPVLRKTRKTAPQKEMHTLAQKHANVKGAFALQTPIKNKRLLVVDDLFDSGATLVEIARVLQTSGAVKVYVLTLTRTIHTDD